MISQQIVPCNPKMIKGLNDFRILVTESDIFIDKTLLIKDIIDSKDVCTLITRPRRWGKSLNLNMLKYFFSVEVNEHGEILPNNPNKILFTGGMENLGGVLGLKKFEALKITEDSKWESKYKKYQGHFPVIYLSLKNCSVNSFSNFQRSLANKIYKVYKDHKYLCKSKILSDLDKEEFQEKFNLYKKLGKSEFNIDLYTTELYESLKFLSEILYLHFSTRSYILIDEYDAPLNDLLSNYNKELYDSVIDLIYNIFSEALKDNSYLEKGIIIGIMSIAQLSLFSNLNNFIEYNILTEIYSEHFGFTEDETRYLLSNYTEVDEEEVKEWYNGYLIGRKRMYNPWSIVQYLHFKKIDNYWLKTANTKILDQILICDDIQTEMDKLINGQAISVKEIKFTYDSLSKNKDVLWSFLLYTGYLTINNYGQLLIPNKEVKCLFEKYLFDWIDSKSCEISNIVFNKINLESIEDVKNNYLKILNLIKNKLGKMNEAIFNHFVTGRLFFEKGFPDYMILIEPKSGQGFPDHIFYPLDKSLKKSIIHEYKFTADINSLEGIIEDAWWQIYEKNYINYSLEKAKILRGINEIIVRPIVFSYEEKTQEINIIIEERIHSLEEATNIYNYFNKSSINKSRLGNKNRKEIRKNLLEKEDCQDLLSLINKMKNENNKFINSQIDSDYSLSEGITQIKCFSMPKTDHNSEKGSSENINNIKSNLIDEYEFKTMKNNLQSNNYNNDEKAKKKNEESNASYINIKRRFSDIEEIEQEVDEPNHSDDKLKLGKKMKKN